jgi:hypothetical protein
MTAKPWRKAHGKLRLKLIRGWDAFRLKIFLTICTRMFGCVAVSAPDKKRVRAIHFAVNQRELNLSVRDYVERLDGSM